MKKSWSYSAGEHGRNRVRVFEHRSGNLMVEYRENGKRQRHSLGHRDRDRAKRQADEIAARFEVPAEPTRPDPTLGELFDIYVREVTPGKGESQQRHDRRSRALFLRFFGRDRKAATLNRRDWDRFILARRAGGLPLQSGGKTRPAGDRTIERDLRNLIAVLNWAERSADQSGNPLLIRNPLRGLRVPKETSPNRPMMTQERYETLLGAADRVDWRFGVALVLCHETGHRIGAIRQLRWDDIDFEFGRIRWRKESDKVGNEHWTHMTTPARAALEQARSATSTRLGPWVIPSPTAVAQPARKEYTDTLFERGERAAGLDHVKGLKWHSLRRKFATDLKHAPLKDLAHMGGWKSERTLLLCYQQPDEELQRRILENRSRGVLPEEWTPKWTPAPLRLVK